MVRWTCLCGHAEMEALEAGNKMAGAFARSGHSGVSRVGGA